LSEVRIDDETLALTLSLRESELSGHTLDNADTEPRAGEVPPRPEPRAPRRPKPVERVGRYRVIRVLGEGGMGVVYSAFDDELARPVALKLLRTSRAGSTRGASEARDRLLREAQAMAQLSHPNVVQVYDVGAHHNEVFIAMELIRGRTLEEWLGELGEPAVRAERYREILDVFVQAGRGLAAAHAVGLVHRDFKPANVLVGDDGGVRVLDFGLARGDLETLTKSDIVVELESSGSKLLDDMTRTGTLLGTPAYFSPEQMRAEPLDTASDQFSFCVALHEALFGVRPYAGETLSQLAVSLREGTRSTPPTLDDVPGWLRAVIDRGLARDPSARWPSMDALLEALLDDPATRRRRWLAVGLGALLLGGLAGGAWVEDAREHARCEALGDSIFEAWSDERRLAIMEAFATSGVGEQGQSWARLEPGLDAWATSWRDARLAACLDPGDGARATCLDRQRWQFESLVDVLGEADRAAVFEAHNAVAALPPVERCGDPGWLAAEPPPAPWWSLESSLAVEVRRDLAQVFALERLGRFEASRELAEAALARARLLDDEALEAEALAKLGAVRWRTGDYVQAEPELNDAHFLAGGVEHDRVAYEAALDLVVVVGIKLGRAREGQTWLQIARMHMRSMGLDPDADARLWFWLGQLEYAAGNYEDALAAHQRAYALRLDTLAPGHPDIASSLTHLGQAQRRLGNYDAALDLLEQALDHQVRALGPNHPEVAYIHDTIGAVLLDLDRTEDALAAYRRALEIERRSLSPDHPELATTLNNYATALFGHGDYEQAAVQLERALSIREALYGPEHSEVAAVLNNLAAVRAELGELELSLELHRRVLAIDEANLGPDHADVGIGLFNIGDRLEQLGDYEQALAHYQRGLTIDERVYGNDHLEVASDLHRVARVHGALGHHAQALELHQRALAIRSRSLEPEHRWLASSHDYVGAELLALGRPELALEHHRLALAIREANRGPDDPGTARSRIPLGEALAALGRDSEALTEFDRAIALLEGGDDPPRLIRALEASAASLTALGRRSEAAARSRRAASLRSPP
jgi:tetratricopeptide (TPR) repeat protein